jgi:transposase
MDGTLLASTDGTPAWCSQEELLGLIASLRQAVETLQREVADLRWEAGYWKSRHGDAVRRIEGLKQELEETQAENRKLEDRLFGKKSEKKSTNRSNGLDQPRDSTNKEKRKRGGQRGGAGHPRRDYSHLPVEEEFVDVPPDQRVCPRCGQPFAEMSDTEDSEQIEIEIRIYRRKTRRKRRRSTCQCYACTRTVTAPCPTKLIRKSRLGTSLWAHVLLDKFASHRPTARLLEELKQHGLDMAPGTVTDGLRRLEPMFVPVYEALLERNRASSLCQADETRWLVFVDQEGKTGHRWWLWVFLGEDTVVYRLDPTRSHDVPQRHFAADAACVLMVDRYSAYKAMPQVKSGTIELAFCWSHVRRDFIDVGKGQPELIDWALAWLHRIRQLYHFNRQRLQRPVDSAKFRQYDDALRAAVASMQSQAAEELAGEKVRAPCRKVLESLQVHWAGLTLFVDDRRVPMDNNASERKMRGPALGRKNYYGSAALWSGRLSTAMFSIFATLKHWKVNPRRWLLWYLKTCAANGGQAPPDVRPYLPWNLAPDHLTSLQTAAPHPTT